MEKEPNKNEAVAWAKAYPFDVGDSSFVYAKGGAYPLNPFSGDKWREASIAYKDGEADWARFAESEGLDPSELDSPRIAVVACGSNAAPTRMAQKFARRLPGSFVPTLKVELRGYCVVHSAKIAAYGSVPATLAPAAGARVTAFVNLLTPAQLAVMDDTEDLGVEYHRPVLEKHSVVLDDETPLEAPQAYISLHGPLHHEGKSYALAAVKGGHIPFDKLHQHEVQSLIQDLLQVRGALDDFIHSNIADSNLRKSRSLFLRDNHSLPPHGV